MIDTGYVCEECGLPVLVADGKITRLCPHKEAIVVATMMAVATGESEMEQQ